ncbi:PfkB family carbohydrate kinase [Photobacterium piscicola]|jgi:sugar/nucleoside kinase (ribokinase family)|uniref:PfkB family carbohydrate kinase n=1 Tax=Photobacterium piscicola TaxID=1378299 RepID=UPI003736CB16
MVDLSSLLISRPIIVIGAAFGDVMLGVEQLPYSGGDITANEIDRQIGGCAFNVIRALSRLKFNAINGIPVGNGSWGQSVESAMARENLPVLLRHDGYDNGWCLALVEANKERTFITIDGCEQYLSPELLAQIPTPDNAIVYVSGYELVGVQSEPLRQWLLALEDDKTLFVDFGPRLPDIDSTFIHQLLKKKPILTLNRDELVLLDSRGAGDLGHAVVIANHYGICIICRFDKDGATVCLPGSEPTHIAAFQVDVVDTIAAGDSHCAGVIAGMSAGWTFSQSVELGNMVAAIVVSRAGSNGSPTKAELLDFQVNNLV